MEKELNSLRDHLNNEKGKKTAELLELTENFKKSIAEEEDSFEVAVKAERFAREFNKIYDKRCEIMKQVTLLNCVETGEPFYY